MKNKLILTDWNSDRLIIRGDTDCDQPITIEVLGDGEEHEINHDSTCTIVDLSPANVKALIAFLQEFDA